jgi:hypothetical protein
MFEFFTVPQPKNIQCVLESGTVPYSEDSRMLLLERIVLSLFQIHNFGDCVRWARSLYDEYLTRIQDIILEHPENEIDTKDGGKFWSPPKRFPSIQDAVFDWQDDLCKRFVLAAAVLKSRSCSIALPEAVDISEEWLSPRSCPLFSQWSQRQTIQRTLASAHCTVDDSAHAADSAAEAAEIERLISLAQSSPPDRTQFQFFAFDKDDPAHMYTPNAVVELWCLITPCFIMRSSAAYFMWLLLTRALQRFRACLF